MGKAESLKQGPHALPSGLGFRVQGRGFGARVQGQDLGLGFKLRARNRQLSRPGKGLFRASGLGFRMYGIGCYGRRVQGLEFKGCI